jgi:hypothetical protein
MEYLGQMAIFSKENSSKIKNTEREFIHTPLGQSKNKNGKTELKRRFGLSKKKT